MRKRKVIEKIIRIEAYILIPVMLVAGMTLFREYNILPGIVEANALEISDKTADSVSLRWKPVRNADRYIVSYKEKTSDTWIEKELSGNVTEYRVEGLEEGASYDFSLRADSEEREGKTEAAAETATKRRQTIEGKKKQMKLAGKRQLELDSETDIKLSSEDEEVAVVNEDQTMDLSPGTVTIKAEAEETEDFEKDETEVELEIVDSVSEETDSAEVHIMYRLDKSNCEVAVTLKDSEVPQSFDYADGKYMVAYGMSSARRIVTYDEEGKSEIKASASLGHPNGFAYSDKGHSVRGWSSECVTIDMENGDCETISLPYGASGIAYDRALGRFYTSSRTALVSYDKDFNKLLSVTPISHKGTYYTQDCGGGSGILMRCLSDSTKHGKNLIDLYDMVNGLYLGTVECDLSEVESAAVDDDGYMLLLCNTKKNIDYIYRTPININDLGSDITAGLKAPVGEVAESADEQL